jgi:hypothetical protein
MQVIEYHYEQVLHVYPAVTAVGCNIGGGNDCAVGEPLNAEVAEIDEVDASVAVDVAIRGGIDNLLDFDMKIDA